LDQTYSRRFSGTVHPLASQRLRAGSLCTFGASQGFPILPSSRRSFVSSPHFSPTLRSPLRSTNEARRLPIHGGPKFGRPRTDHKEEERIRKALAKGDKGIFRIASEVGVGSGTVERIKAEMAAGAA
jgi:hypothetical protein